MELLSDEETNQFKYMIMTLMVRNSQSTLWSLVLFHHRKTLYNLYCHHNWFQTFTLVHISLLACIAALGPPSFSLFIHFLLQSWAAMQVTSLWNIDMLNNYIWKVYFACHTVASSAVVFCIGPPAPLFVERRAGQPM